MQILNVEPKDIHVTLDLSITEIGMLLEALDKAKIDYDGKTEPKMAQATEFLGVFFKMLAEVEESVGSSKRTTA